MPDIQKKPRGSGSGNGFATRGEKLKTLAAHPEILKAGLRLNLFLAGYMRKFRVRKVGRHLILHSHLPPLNSPAQARFIREHLLRSIDGPSHAQIALTNACPQRCSYCYNRDRRGTPMDKATILRTIGELRRLGVFWLGFTGGEPLLNRDIVEITRAAAEKEIALKLFTTGLGLTPNLAAELREAGLFSVSVSLDHWEESVHDRVRGFKGAYRAALQAIATLLAAGGLHVGVSAVLSKEMIASGDAERFLEFLSGLEVHEAWLSETKPAVLSGPKIDLPTHEERLALIRLQDRWNRRRGLTVNYLAHFESGRHFGCNAGRKMIYIDPFGEVSPCVFAPLSFGNVGRRPLAGIYEDMKKRFASSGRCFVNAHAGLFGEYGGRGIPLPPEESRALLESASFGRPSRFFRIFRTKKG